MIIEKDSETEVSLENRRVFSVALIGGDAARMETMCGMLMMEGIQSRTFGSAESAFSAMEGHLAVADVIMPAMNGKELTRKILSLRPNIKLLFMSGCPTDVVACHGIPENGTRLIQKPFTLQELAAAVREVLDA